MWKWCLCNSGIGILNGFLSANELIEVKCEGVIVCEVGW